MAVPFFNGFIMKILATLILLYCTQLLFAQPSTSELKPFLQTLEPSGQPELLLLGIDTQRGLQTLVVEIKEGKAILQPTLPYLATPQRDGFWYLQKQMIYEYVEADSDDAYMQDMSLRCDHLFIGKSPTELVKRMASYKNKPSDGKEANWSEDGTILLNWVAPGFISYAMLGGGYYGGAHPSYFGNEGVTERFDDFKTCKHYKATATEEICDRTVKKQGLKSIIPEANWQKAAQVLAAKAKKGEFYDTMDGEPVEGREADIANMEALMTHRAGLLYPIYAAYADAMYIESVTYSFTAIYEGNTPLKSKGLAFNTLPFKFEALAKVDPKLKDLYLSPKHNVLVLSYGPYALLLDGTTGKELLRLETPGSTCMADWAIGSSVERWKGILVAE